MGHNRAQGDESVPDGVLKTEKRLFRTVLSRSNLSSVSSYCTSRSNWRTTLSCQNTTAR